MNTIFKKLNIRRRFIITASLALFTSSAFARNGIDIATVEILGYFGSLSNLSLAIGGIIGTVGAIRVYIKWNNGDQDLNKSIMGWAGACIFLISTSGILKAFFNL